MSTPAFAVPQADPGAEYRALKVSIDAAVERALASGQYVLATEGAAFEREFAAWLGVSYAVGCASGTDALTLALRALGIGRDGSVVTVSHTAVAVAAAIELAGATPICSTSSTIITRSIQANWRRSWSSRHPACRRSAP